MLRLAQIHHTYNPGTANVVYAVRDISLFVPDGQFVTIIGSNGAGKSTLFNLIAGIYAPRSGRIYIDGEDITDLAEHERGAFIGRVFQDPYLGTAGTMSIAENMFLAHSRGQALHLRRGITPSLRQLFKNHLEPISLGLEIRLDTGVKYLSGGQRQALTLAMAVLGSPKVLLLDEHTASLDPSTAATIMKVTSDTISKHGITTLMITHNIQQALDYGHRLLMMDRGRIVLDIEGESKSAMTVQELVEKFRITSDKMLADDGLPRID